MTTPAHEAATGAAYDALAQRYADFAPGHYDAHPLERALIPALAESADPARPVADLGCGPGHVAAHLHTLGLRVLGLDLSHQLLTHAARTHPGPGLVRARLGALPLASGCLGAILSHYSIIHTPPEQMPAIFTEWVRVLAPGGLVLVSFQTREPGQQPEPFDHAVAPAHRHSSAHLLQAARAAGLDQSAHMVVAASQDTARARPQAHLLLHRTG